MTVVDNAGLGQKGMDPKDGSPLPGRDDPVFHLASMLGMMAGDKYRPETPPGQGFGTDELAQAVQVSAREQGQSDQVPKGSVLNAASKYMGVPYHYGANDPKYGLDCSSFVQRSFADIGISLPRVTYDQVKTGVAIADKNQLQPGDLIFLWGDGGRRDGHVGIYAGNGMMLNEPHTGASVRYDKVNWGRVTNMRRVT